MRWPPETVDGDLGPAEPPILGDIPCGYGGDRITVLAVDPYWMFVYWEVTDGALDQARRRAGAAAGDCLLRVHDTTHRLFDGTNAHWHTDVPVYRPANSHYVAIARPGSTFHVDIGVAGPAALSPRLRAREPSRCRELGLARRPGGVDDRHAPRARSSAVPAPLPPDA